MDFNSDKKFTHKLLQCKTKIQAYCGLTNCRGNKVETCFLYWKLFWRQLQVFHAAFLFSLLPSLSKLPSRIKAINLDQ